MCKPILHDVLPHTPWTDPVLSRLPGLRPVEGGWIVVDEVYSAQLAEKARLLAARRDDVLRVLPRSAAAQAELLEVAVEALPAGFVRRGDAIERPDGVVAPLDGPPLEVLSRLLQEDLLLLEPEGAEHVLTAGLLCFPASWALAEKIGHPLARIHRPVPEYDTPLAGRVQRLFDRLPEGPGLWRANVLGYADPALFQPRAEAEPRDHAARPRFLRSERQTMLRLPRTGAVLFAVHTWVVPLDRLTPAQRADCPVG